MRKFLIGNIAAYAAMFVLIGVLFSACDVHAGERSIIIDMQTAQLLTISVNGQKMDVEYIYDPGEDEEYCILHLPYRQGTIRALKREVLICEDSRTCILDPEDYITNDNIDN